MLVKGTITVPNTADAAPALNNANQKVMFKNCTLFTDFLNLKEKEQVKPETMEQKSVEIKVLLKYLSNIWRTFETPLINCEISLLPTWSANYVIVSTNVANQGATFAITDTKLYVPVVTLSTQDNIKLLR